MIDIILNIIQRHPHESIWIWLVGVRFALQVWDIRSDYPPLTLDMSIKHDEKVILPQTRIRFLKGKQRNSDYYPLAVGADYGILCPAITLFCFKIFGLNNLALRLPYVIIGNLWLGLAGLSIMHIAPGITGLLIALLILLNYNIFLLTRYAIVDNIFMLHLSLLAAGYIFKHDAFINNLPALGFVSAALVLVRIQFAGFASIFLAIIGFIEGIGFEVWYKFIAYSLNGYAVFELFVLAMFWRIGILSYYIHEALKVYVHGMRGKDERVIHNWKPTGLSFIKEYVRTMMDWFLVLHSTREIYLWVYPLFIAILSLYLDNIQPMTKIFTLYILVYLSAQFLFFFYGKRTLITLLAVPILLASLSRDLSLFLSSYIYIMPELFLGLFWAWILIGMLVSQYPVVKRAIAERTDALAKYSKIVDQCIPEGSIVYMTSHAFRAVWQSQRRMIFVDDSFVDNQMTLSNAFAENAAFVALDDERGDIDFEDLSRLKLLHEIKVSDVEADIAMTIYIYEIVKEKESDGRIQPSLIKILADIQKNIKIIKSAEDRNKINESLESIKESTDRLLCCVKQGMKLDGPFVDKTVYKTACILKTYGETDRSYNLFNALSHKLTPMDDRDLLARIYFNLGGIKREAGDIGMAKEYWKSCLKIMPEHRMARRHLKYYCGTTFTFFSKFMLLFKGT